LLAYVAYFYFFLLSFFLPCSPAIHPSSQFPYYTFVDRGRMYSVGSLFYAIYFWASFPMLYRIDENTKNKKWTLGEVSEYSSDG
jgi:hypothetical protein